MARYIDADLLLEEVENNTPLNWTDSEIELQEQFDFQVFKHIIEYQPTADVVPKSEVEMHGGSFYFELENELEKAREGVERFMREHDAKVAREIFEEIEREITDALQSNYKVLPKIEASEELYHCVHGKISALCGIDGFVEELKKKYTEGEGV